MNIHLPSFLLLRLASIVCILFLFLMLPEPARSKDVLEFLLCLSVYAFIVLATGVASGFELGCALFTGLFIFLVTRFIISATGFGVPAAPAPHDYLPGLSFANLGLFIVALCTWVWKRKEINWQRVLMGFLAGLAYWALLTGAAFAFS